MSIRSRKKIACIKSMCDINGLLSIKEVVMKKNLWSLFCSLLVLIVVFVGAAHAGFSLDSIKKGAQDLLKENVGSNSSLSGGEISQGLKEALTVGMWYS